MNDCLNNIVQELKELAALAYRDTTAENREFWKNELSQVVRDIQAEYDSKIDAVRCEMETFYNLKVAMLKKCLQFLFSYCILCWIYLKCISSYLSIVLFSCLM